MLVTHHRCRIDTSSTRKRRKGCKERPAPDVAADVLRQTARTKLFGLYAGAPLNEKFIYLATFLLETTTLDAVAHAVHIPEMYRAGRPETLLIDGEQPVENI
eukprot:950553_1